MSARLARVEPTDGVARRGPKKPRAADRAGTPPSAHIRTDPRLDISIGIGPFGRPFYAWNELPQPQVDFTLGLLNLKPEPSSVST